MPGLPSTTTLGQFLRDGRKRARLTQKELAEKAFGDKGLFQQVSNYERGAYIPSAPRMVRLIVALDIGPAVAWQAWGEEHLDWGADDFLIDKYVDYLLATTSARGDAAARAARMATGEARDPTPEDHPQRRAGDRNPQ